MFAPCNLIYTPLGFTADTISNECIHDLQAQRDYLQSLRVSLFVNDEKFEPEQYGEASIKKYSKVIHMQIDQNNPIWIDYRLQMKQLSDESQYLQFGFSEDTDFYSN